MLIVIKYVLIIIVCFLLILYAYNALTAPRDTQYQSVVFISGSYTRPYLLAPWRSYLQSHFPGAEVTMVEGYYTYKGEDGSSERLEEMKADTKSTLRASQETEGPVLVIAYSYGGVLLDTAFHELQEAGYNFSQMSIVTIASPLAPDRFFLDQNFIDSRNALGFSDQSLPNHVSVCGYFDSLVDCQRANYDTKKAEVASWSNHYMFMLPQLFAGRSILEALVHTKKPL